MNGDVRPPSVIDDTRPTLSLLNKLLRPLYASRWRAAADAGWNWSAATNPS